MISIDPLQVAGWWLQLSPFFHVFPSPRCEYSSTLSCVGGPATTLSSSVEVLNYPGWSTKMGVTSNWVSRRGHQPEDLRRAQQEADRLREENAQQLTLATRQSEARNWFFHVLPQWPQDLDPNHAICRSHIKCSIEPIQIMSNPYKSIYIYIYI